MIIKDSSVEIEDLGDGVSRKILASGGKMMTTKIFIEKGAVGAVHSHPHEQSSYVLKGSLEYNFDGEKQIVREGDTIYLPPETKHGVVALEESILLDVFTPQREDFLSGK